MSFAPALELLGQKGRPDPIPRCDLEHFRADLRGLAKLELGLGVLGREQGAMLFPFALMRPDDFGAAACCGINDRRLLDRIGGVRSGDFCGDFSPHQDRRDQSASIVAEDRPPCPTAPETASAGQRLSGLHETAAIAGIEHEGRHDDQRL